MKVSSIGWVCVAAVTLLTSCVSIPIPERLSGGSGGSLGWKVVAEKREPNLLYAPDRRECTVDGDRFEAVRRGDRVFCHWRTPKRPPLGMIFPLGKPEPEGP